MEVKFLERIAQLKTLFLELPSKEERYKLIMDWGKKLQPISENEISEDSLVVGCQSTMHLLGIVKEGKLYFKAHSDALISAGLAALLLHIYNGETPEILLKNPPHFFEEIGIMESLSPTRANGFASLFQKMKQRALKALIHGC